MADINDRLITIEATLLIQKGQIEILLGLISSKIGKDALQNYLEYVLELSDFGDSAKISAQEMLFHQDRRLNNESFSRKKQ